MVKAGAIPIWSAYSRRSRAPITVERSGPGQRFGHNAGAAAHNLSCDTLHAPGHLGRGAALKKGHQQDPAGIGPR